MGAEVCRAAGPRRPRQEGRLAGGDRRSLRRAKEFLAGYWIVDCESTERAYAIAARASAAPGKRGVPLNMPIEVREVMSAPPVEV